MAKISPDESCPCGSGALFKDCHGPKVRVPTPPEIKERLPLKVIPEPDPNTRTVFEKGGADPKFFQSFHTNIALVCGSCSSVLAAGMRREDIQNIVLRCNQCQSFNEA